MLTQRPIAFSGTGVLRNFFIVTGAHELYLVTLGLKRWDLLGYYYKNNLYTYILRGHLCKKTL